MRRFGRFLAPSISCIAAYMLVASGNVNAVSELRGMAAGSCIIDNDESTEANMFVSTAEIFNGDATADGKVQCSLGTSDGFGSDTNDIDTVTLYVYDGNDAEGFSAVLGSHATGEGAYSSCGTATTPDAYTGNNTMQWSSLRPGCCVELHGLRRSVGVPFNHDPRLRRHGFAGHQLARGRR